MASTEIVEGESRKGIEIVREGETFVGKVLGEAVAIDTGSATAAAVTVRGGTSCLAPPPTTELGNKSSGRRRGSWNDERSCS